MNKIVVVLLLLLVVALLVLLMTRSSECHSVAMPASRVAITGIKTLAAATEIISSHLAVAEGVAVVAAVPLELSESPDRQAAIT